MDRKLINPFDHQYHELLKDVLLNGELKTDRTGTGTYSKFGAQMRFDLKRGFPLITTKKVAFKSLFWELIWFLRGETNIKFLQEHGCTIWDEWADESGELGPVYGSQWRSWQSGPNQYVDQIKEVIWKLKNKPDDRRIIVSAWNVGEVPNMKLPPCHAFFQFYVNNNKELSCHLYQRSCDMFLGVPFNIASYALLVHLMAKTCDLQVGEFIWSGGDVHIYTNHKDQVLEQIGRESFAPPTFGVLNKKDDPMDYDITDILLMDYIHHPPIKAPVAV